MGAYYGRLACFIFALCCCMAVISVVNIAFAASTGEYIPRDVRYRQAGLDSLSRMRVQYDLDKAGFTQQKWAQQFPNHKSLPVEYPKSRISQMARTASRGAAWNVAAMAAVAAAGWAIDELTQQVSTVEHIPVEDPTISPDGSVWVNSNDVVAYNYSCPGLETRLKSATSVQCRAGSYIYYSWGLEPCSNHVSFCSLTPRPDPLTEEQYLPVPPEQVDDVVYESIKNLPSHQIESGFKNQHNQPKMTPELEQALQDWYQDLADRDPNLSYDPASKTFTYNDPDTGETTVEQVDDTPSTNTDTETNTPVAGSDWPGFCDWATVVCDWLEWTKEFEEPVPEEMPFEEINLADIQEDFDSGLGSGSCPSPETANFMGQPIVYSFETACMAAETFFKPVLLITASIIAGFIIVGASRKGV